MAYSTDDARYLDQLCYDLVLADFPRGLQRALINSSANGEKPYTNEEAETNGIRVNCSDLTMLRLCQQARLQYDNGFLGQAAYFSAQTDMGPKHKRSIYNSIVAKEANSIYKESISYFETLQAKFGSLVLHGIGPAVYPNADAVEPDPIGVEDALIPGRTLLGFKNLPAFALRKTFTSNELKLATRRSKRDPGWNMDLVQRCEEWMDEEMTQMAGDNWTDLWSPEKWEERAKEDVGISAGDEAPAIRCFDIYIYREATKKNAAGWIRRIILDSWSTPAISGGSISMGRNEKMKDKKGESLEPSKNDFLFTSGDRVVAENWNQIVTFQFADLSAVTPRRYHSVRGLGWMEYAACHLKNRQWCKQNEAMFEALLQYFKVKSMDDVQRAMKLELANMGIIDETITPVPAAERWQPNVNLIEYVSGVNQSVIEDNSRWTTGQPKAQNKERESNFQRMADIQQVNALVSAGLNQAYQYQKFEYRENFRRLLRPNSKDPRARQFRANCLRQGVPEGILVPEAWDIQSERMMGGGNQTLEMMIANQIMEWRPMLDPEPQRVALRDSIMALTKNPAKALELVPETPNKVTPSVVQATNAATALLNGVEAPVQTGINHIEYVEEMLKILAQRVLNGKQSGGMVDAKELQGLQAIMQNIQQHIAIIAQDPSQKQRVKKYSEMLSKLGNEVKGFEQRLQQAMQAQQKQQQNGNGKLDPKDAAKIQATTATAQSKISLAAKSHAQKTAQRQVQFEQGLKQKQEQHQADIASKDLETAANIQRGGMKSLDEGDDD
jgi:hypothetical protein